MEMQICQYDPPTMADRTIKIERDDTEGETCGSSGTDIPCVSTVPIPADKNTGSYYYPSQAVVAPRTPVFTTVSKMAQKRKTIQALAQAALMNVEEPILFEETICCNNVKIVLIDNKTKQIIPREHLRKEDNTTPQTSQATDSIITGSTTSATRDTPGQPLGIEKSYSLRHKTGSTTTQPEEITTSSASNSVTSSYNTTNFPANTTTTATISSAVAATTVTTRPVQNQPTRPETISTATTPRPRTSLLNSLPSERTEPPKSLSSKLPPNQTSYKPLAAAPSASVRPETVTNSKTAICLPNTVSRTESSLTRAVYVPKEINLGATELRLEDCINVKDICDKELTKWTAEDVAKFVRATDCYEYAHVFVDQEIDGKALTLLNQDFLIQWMKLKLGPAMKLNCHIINLKHSLNTN